MPNAEIVAIGSELLLGQIVDTNSAWMAQRLSDLGINLFFKTIVGDNPGRMKEVIGRALDRADLVITSGGLGPTQDDLTREVIAEVCGRRLVRDPGLLEQIDHRFRRRGMIMTPNNERQADIPEGAIPGGESQRHRAIVHRRAREGYRLRAARGAPRDEVALRERGGPVRAAQVRPFGNHHLPGAQGHRHGRKLRRRQDRAPHRQTPATRRWGCSRTPARWTCASPPRRRAAKRP